MAFRLCTFGWRIPPSLAWPASAVFGALALVVLAWPLRGWRGEPEAPSPKVVLGGQEIPFGSEGDAKALEVLRGYARGSVAVDLARGGAPEKRAVSRAALGLDIDKVRLRDLLQQARDPASAMRGGGPPAKNLVLPMPVSVRRGSALAWLVRLKDEVDRPALDARFDLETKKLVPEQAGYFLDVYGTLGAIETAMSSGLDAVRAESERTAPRLVASQMGGVGFGEVLGWFETRYAADKKHEARTFNLRLAASKLDGHVILPGETFDFNDIVGPRDEANGYKVAPVIAQGELVDGIGGGTCQIAGTLHGAGFFAGLDVVERHPHTRPSFYIKMGLDATVVYPTITMRLRNSFDHPVVLHETVRDGVVRAEVLGPKRSRTVTFVRKIDEVLPFAEIERQDPKLPRGTRVLAQRGIPGFRTHRYRVVRDGPFAVRERWNDSYPPTNQIIRVGTADGADAEGVEDDPHPEYVADGYLVLMQGPDVKGTVPSTGSTAGQDDPDGRDGGGMVELREAGRTGERGWTERAGFSHYLASRSERAAPDRSSPDGDKRSSNEPKHRRSRRRERGRS